MTNFEYIKGLNCQQLGHFLCEFMDDAYQEDICKKCPVKDKCHKNSLLNGWITWLMEEHR